MQNKAVFLCNYITCYANKYIIQDTFYSCNTRKRLKVYPFVLSFVESLFSDKNYIKYLIFDLEGFKLKYAFLPIHEFDELWSDLSAKLLVWHVLKIALLHCKMLRRYCRINSTFLSFISGGNSWQFKLCIDDFTNICKMHVLQTNHHQNVYAR